MEDDPNEKLIDNKAKMVEQDGNPAIASEDLLLKPSKNDEEQ